MFRLFPKFETWNLIYSKHLPNNQVGQVYRVNTKKSVRLETMLWNSAGEQIPHDSAEIKRLVIPQ